ncbi:Glycoprotein-N-acetylgalactosamine 3-beta-galactosyltransferase 1 [Fasciola gigantica]|uniref:N-acetylgalactosaminide beta-1,3-galactosyltransferase n=1 Tax=Fasciola gigantica TaxID=46835 RepID=A0A504YJN5_FASGI|nr:Glycoprotein-N-acetylgalactosamine 3-beta-galactosyltransferase 1 [Fasciola gigantica]
MNTWARQCTKLVFISSEDSTELPVVNLNLTYKESRKHLWSKMQKALKYFYGFRDEFDFFYKADDDTYATVINLQYALKDLDPNKPIIAGYPFTHIIQKGHLSGGAGYVLSRRTLKLLVEQSINKHSECPTFDEDLEDVKISMCSYAIGAEFVPIIDRHTTIPYSMDSFHQNEYRFQWMNLNSLFEHELTVKKKANADRPVMQNLFGS